MALGRKIVLFGRGIHGRPGTGTADLPQGLGGRGRRGRHDFVVGKWLGGWQHRYSERELAMCKEENALRDDFFALGLLVGPDLVL
jgi:hypothetical protein